MPPVTIAEIDSVVVDRFLVINVPFTIHPPVFILSICRNDFWMAIIAQVLFGSGASSVSAVQRISISKYLEV